MLIKLRRWLVRKIAPADDLKYLTFTLDNLGVTMVTQEQLDAYLADVTAAKLKLEAAQKAFDAAQPHLAFLGEIEAFASKYESIIGADATAELKALKAKGLGLLEKFF